MQQWEYITLTQEMIKDPETIKQSLPTANNEFCKLGRQGWELVNVQNITIMGDLLVFVYFLKRLVQQESKT